MEEIERCRVVTVTGELDILSASVLYSALATFSAHESIVVDCGGVEYIDSYGLAAILRRRRELAVHGGSLRLRHPSLEVLRILAVCGTVERLLEDEPLQRDLARFGLLPSLDRTPSVSGG
jgi:anti-anti-sigma factor